MDGNHILERTDSGQAASPGMGRFHLNGNQLKRIALITMLIDHIGYLLIEAGALVFFSVYSREFFYFYYLDLTLRTIGRIAFPIYAFMVVEGFYHTRDWRKYARNLAILLVVSEIPFNLMVSGRWFDPSYQNVYFTLLSGLLMLKTIHTIRAKVPGKMGSLCAVATAAVFSFLCWLLQTDYSYGGIILIFLLYWFRENRCMACLLGAACMLIQECPVAPVLGIGIAASFLLIYFYDGTRKPSRWKYGYYIFYPVHMSLLYLIYRIIFG